MNDNDTIFALATPNGKSGVAIIRISGKDAIASIELFNIKVTLKPRYAHYCTLHNPTTGCVADNVLLLYFQSPHSFTGEDVVEIHCHGSKAVIEEITSILLSSKCARYAEAGEFTKRAFFNNKLDYVQVEALHDLIESETPKQKNLALDNLNGKLSRQYTALYESIIEARAFCEVFLDFPDDDLPDDLDSQINSKIRQIQNQIDSLLLSADYGRQVKEGIKVAIIGKPNSGKSTLLNALSNKDAAIVSDIEGTTRDIIEVSIDIKGQQYNFYDTAGLRDTDNIIETIGIEKTKKIYKNADIVIVLFDISIDNYNDALNCIKHENIIYVANKADLVKNASVSRETILISAIKNDGLETLKQRILSSSLSINEELPVITRQRHIQHLHNAQDHINKALLENDLTIKASYLIYTGNELLSILGKIDFEDILDSLFSSFCIGK